MPGHFTKTEKNLFLENVAVKFKWWVYKICSCHCNCKVWVLVNFSCLGCWIFISKMYRNLYMGIQRWLLHHVEKVRRKKVLNIVIALQKKITFLTCTYFSLCSLFPFFLEWISLLVGSYNVGTCCIFTGACNFLTVSLSF